MAGIFKSIDQSDIRVTPFRSYKLWTDQDVSYNYVTNSISNEPLSELFVQTYNRSVGDNSFYALKRNAVDPDQGNLFRIDGEEDFALLATQNKISYAFGEMSTGLDKILGFSPITAYLFNSDLTIDSSNGLPQVDPIVVYDACFDYNTGNIFAATQEDPNCGGLYEYVGNQDYTALNAIGDYWGVDTTPTNKICTLFKSSSGADIYLALYEPNSAGVIDKGPYEMGPKPNALRTFFVNQSDTLAIDNFSIWCLFDDDSLYLSSGDIQTTILALSDVAEILLDNDYYDYSTSTYLTQRVHIVMRSGHIYFDAYYDYYNNVLKVGSDLDLSSYVGIGMGNVIQRASITRNNQILNAGDAVISITAGNNNTLNESLYFTVNTGTYDITDPISLGSTKSTINLVSYNNNKTYAADYTASINVNTGTFVNNWYAFNQ
jgi:hypothetical protein